uniref:Uncharacterized protein n=1 Tax=Fagus sylvatica TaxID=28930 RepID=A0A2N9GXY6_FAGSY
MRQNACVGRVAALVGAWEHVCTWLENQKLLATREGACEAGSGRFWWQWTDLDEIYPMELFRESNSDSEMRIPRKANKARGFAISGKRP